MRRITLAALAAALCMIAAWPASAATKSYSKDYVGASTPGIAFRWSPGQTNPGDTNLADEFGELEGTPADAYPLRGTPADECFLCGSPADVNLAGVVFEKGTYQGTPFKLKVEDATGLPVKWSACQRNGTNPVCGLNSDDVQISGCGTPAGGRALAGFARGTFAVWIILSDSAGIHGDPPCDGPASMGTVTLITEV